VLVVGAGDAGQLVIREMQRNRQLGYTPIGLIDDDPRKKNLRIHGVRVLGTTDDLRTSCATTGPDEVILAIPSASGDMRQRIVNVTREGNVPVKTLPGLYELIADDSNLRTQLRRCRSRTCSAASRSRSTSRRPAAYLKTRPCWSPAPAARSAPSSAARSRASARSG
jgi:FlaA1/EpsC-like NDP-sugar epimerase